MRITLEARSASEDISPKPMIWAMMRPSRNFTVVVVGGDVALYLQRAIEA